MEFLSTNLIFSDRMATPASPTSRQRSAILFRPEESPQKKFSAHFRTTAALPSLMLSLKAALRSTPHPSMRTALRRISAVLLAPKENLATSAQSRVWAWTTLLHRLLRLHLPHHN